MTTPLDDAAGAAPPEAVADNPTTDRSPADTGEDAAAIDAPAVPPDLASQLDSVERHLADIVRLAEVRERTVDRLHEEVQRLRVGELRHAVSPLLRDLLTLHDDLAGAVRQHSRAESEARSLRGVADLAVFRDTVGDILYRFGVEPLAVAVGDALNVKEHRVVGTTPTTDAASDRTIAEVVRAGYRDESRVIRSSDVRVFRCVIAGADAG